MGIRLIYTVINYIHFPDNDIYNEEYSSIFQQDILIHLQYL